MNKVVLITGTSTGFGRAAAETLGVRPVAESIQRVKSVFDGANSAPETRVPKAQ